MSPKGIHVVVCPFPLIPLHALSRLFTIKALSSLFCSRSRTLANLPLPSQHTIANGRIVDADNAETQTGKHMAAEAVGKTYLWLAQQEPTGKSRRRDRDIDRR